VRGSGRQNIESVPSEAGPDLGGIEQGTTNIEGRFFAALRMTTDNGLPFARE